MTGTVADPLGAMPPVGRFAPSPTGPLHFGSLVAAMGSFLQARRGNGRWLVRMEDIDPLREVPGAADGILRTLEAYGFEWDGEVVFQSRRRERYQAALARLQAAGLAYACGCSRRELTEVRQRLGLAPGVYPGTCRGRRGMPTNANGRYACRLLVADRVVGFTDLLQGEQRQAVAREVGDFVILRADGQYAYQLAVVVDDAAQGVTEVVRGSDLLDSTPRQLYLQEALGLPTPRYLHLPVVVNGDGEKLSKQTHARPLPLSDPLPSLWAAARFLGQEPPPSLAAGRVADFWRWALASWHPGKVAPRLTGSWAALPAARRGKAAAAP